MYKFYVVPDATTYREHADLFQVMQPFWVPSAESDAYAIMEPKLKGELNKADSFEFTILPANIHYNDFHKRITVVIGYDDDDIIFDGVVTSAVKDFNKQRKVTCSSCLSFLCDSIQAPDEKNEIITPVSPTYAPYNGDGKNHSNTTYTNKASTKETIKDHLQRLLDVHNSQVDPFKTIGMKAEWINAESDEKEFKSASYRTTWDAIESDILNKYGRYLSVAHDPQGNLYLRYLDIQMMASTSGSMPVIEFASNMLDLSETDDNDSDLFTVLVPVGKNGLTVADLSGHDSPSSGSGWVDPYVASWAGNKRYVVVSNAAVKAYGYIVKTQSFSDVDDVDDLYDKAVEYIRNNFDFHIEYSTKAVDAHVINPGVRRIKVGDKCWLKSEWHQVDEDELYVISAEYDLMNPENDTYEIGIPTSDKDAKNSTLSGQSSSSSSSSSSGIASNSSNIDTFVENLKKWINVMEWGLELHGELHNEVVSNDGHYRTRFTQDERHIELLAQKTFGETDQDQHFLEVTQEMKDSVSAAWPEKTPASEGWYEYDSEKGEYVPTGDTTLEGIVSGKRYYYRWLWARITTLNVDDAGLHGRVNANTERGVATSSWIEANEDQIAAITGHLYVDENGQLIIDSGAGFTTGHKDVSGTGTPQYRLVAKSKYMVNGMAANPQAKGWYVKKKDSTGQAVSGTTSDCFELTTDRIAYPSDYPKYYELVSDSEQFTADFGVYDKGNLTAGVVVSAVNDPDYEPIELSRYKRSDGTRVNPNASGWYVVDETSGKYVLSTDTVTNDKTQYYEKINNYRDDTVSIKGKRIVLGYYDGYEGITDASLKARYTKYIQDHNLEGTITEIASDIVVVNALFAKYIEADNITANTSLWTDYLWANHIHSFNEATVATHLITPDIWLKTNPQHDATEDNSILKGLLSTIKKTDPQTMQPAEDLNGSLRADTSGDTVTISLWTMDNVVHKVSFNKPASLGTVTWSDGDISHGLVVKTEGDKEFFRATVNMPYKVANDEITYYDHVNIQGVSSLNGKPVLKATLEFKANWTKYTSDPTYQGEDPVVWTQDIYIDATKAYNDGIDDTKDSISLSSPTTPATPYTSIDSTAMTYPETGLAYNTTYMVYPKYKGTRFGNTLYFKTPPDNAAAGAADVSLSGPTYMSPQPTQSSNPTAWNSFVCNSYNTAYEVKAMYNGQQVGSPLYFWTPVDNASSGGGGSLTNNDIDIPTPTLIATGATQPSDTIHVTYSNSISIARQTDYWLYFYVSVTGLSQPKRYRIKIVGPS